MADICGIWMNDQIVANFSDTMNHNLTKIGLYAKQTTSLVPK